MKTLTRVFTPTNNRRLNELAGLVLFASAILLFLALVSYSPLDPSFNTASSPVSPSPARNYIGVVGAMVADLLLQVGGISILLLPVMLWMLGMRWFRSRIVEGWMAKAVGAVTLLIFVPALLALLPWTIRFKHAVPIEGLLGRITGDFLVHYLNLAGATIVSLGVIAAALYLSTAFSLGALQLWLQTRFSFSFALWDRFQDWRKARAVAQAKRKAEAAKKAAQKPVLTTQLIQRRTAGTGEKSGIDRVTEEIAHRPTPSMPATAPTTQIVSAAPGVVVEVPVEEDPKQEITIGTRADSERKAKTILPKIAGGYKLPSTSLLHRPDDQRSVNEDELKELAEVLVAKCAEFDVHGQIVQINPGPVVTTFEFKPDSGIKYSRITSLQEDLCLALRAESVLIERMPGKATVGIQVPNRDRETIWLREVIEGEDFAGAKSRLTLAMGKDINGRMVTADLASMPHLLIAGSTGAGKSVAINAFIMSLLYKATPEQLRLILVDPKRLELGNYEGVPHLYTPIITEPKLASNALRNAVREMEQRLKLLAARGVRNLDQYNKLFNESTPSLFGEDGQAELKPLPYIVIIIDELADLMMLDGNNVEESITRLAQMSRAVGIHLVLATQRPSVDVITGLIKANFPSRVSFRVATKIDSRTILDANGAESLLGRGDMLYLPSGSARVTRVHAPFVTEKEIAGAVEFWKAQGTAQYEEKFLQPVKDESGRNESGSAGDDGEEDNDELLEDAVRLVLEFGKASTSLLQRRLRIGYGRAAHLIDLMEKDGIVGPADGPKPREILKRPDWLTEVEEALR